MTAAALILGGVAVAAPAQALDGGATRAADLPGLLVVAAETTTPSYDRDLFEHWIDADGDGCNTRYEVLIATSTTPASVGARCSLSGGTWVSAMDGVTATSPAQIEIDHVVALAEAWRSGASGWTAAQRRDFANDLDVPYALQPASSSSNQSKSDKDPAKWMPTNASYRCEYLTSWALVKYRWSLAVDEAERAALSSGLSGECGQSPVALPTVMIARGADVPHVVPGIGSDPSGGEPGDFTPGVTRLAGGDRYSTAVEISRQYAPGVEALFVATGANFPDALAAASAAAALGGPLLLTKPTSLPPEVRARIAALEPRHIYVAGSEGVVSDAVFAELSAIAPVTRLGGTTRYDTALDIVEASFVDGASEAFIATGRNFPDALGATGAAGARRAPLLLVDGAQPGVTARTLEVLQKLGVTSISLIGSPSVVSSGIEQQLRGLGLTVTRYGGPDRYTTAALVNRAYFPAGSTSTAFLATGQNFPDALAGAALAGRMKAPLFVTRPTCVPDSARAALRDLQATSTAVLGGTSVVSADAAQGLGCLSASVPTVSGTAQVGKQLTANAGAWTAGTTFAYRWYANGAVISGASGASLTLTSAQQGRRITVVVTGSAVGFVSASVTSAAVGPVAAAPPAPPAKPANPGDTKNCGDFASHAQAQAWFDTYYPYYGDIAKLDGDGDGIACEGLR